MELIFLIASIIITCLVIWFTGRLVHDSNEELIKAYRRSTELATMHILFGMLFFLVVLITLFACNNTFWHLPYLSR
jgi:putative exporter of polyketide antibiotics